MALYFPFLTDNMHIVSNLDSTEALNSHLVRHKTKLKSMEMR